MVVGVHSLAAPSLLSPAPSSPRAIGACRSGREGGREGAETCIRCRDRVGRDWNDACPVMCVRGEVVGRWHKGVRVGMSPDDVSKFRMTFLTTFSLPLFN